jgi:hypothetical protein
MEARMAANKRAPGGRQVRDEMAHTSVMTEVATGLLTRKYTPEVLKKAIAAAVKLPVIAHVCRETGLSRHLLRYYIGLSKKNHPAFNIVVDEHGNTEKFHVLFEDAMQEGFDRVETMAYNLATGMAREVLDYQGKVTYKSDPELLALGLRGEDAYLRDENGDPVPETKPLMDPEMVRWILARRRPDDYGNKMKVEHEHKGGVLVVGAQMTPQQIEQSFGGQQKIVDVEFDEIPAATEGKS